MKRKKIYLALDIYIFLKEEEKKREREREGGTNRDFIKFLIDFIKLKKNFI